MSEIETTTTTEAPAVNANPESGEKTKPEVKRRVKVKETTPQVKAGKSAKATAAAKTGKAPAKVTVAAKKGGVTEWQKKLAPLRKLVTTAIEMKQLGVNATAVKAIAKEIKPVVADLEKKGVKIPRRLAARLELVKKMV